MEEGKVNLFISTMTDKFKSEHLWVIRKELQDAPDSSFAHLQALPYKNPIVLFIVSLFVGTLGIDRILLGDIGLGILKLVTCGGFGIWTIVDWFLVMNKTKDKNFELFMSNVRRI